MALIKVIFGKKSPNFKKKIGLDLLNLKSPLLQVTKQQKDYKLFLFCYMFCYHLMPNLSWDPNQ
jgi:hypothetical protein